MPLSGPKVPRQEIHCRRIECHGYQRDDGLWDIEGRLVDTKTYAFESRHRGGQVHPGEHIHDMSVRLTLDLDFVIRDVEAVTDFSPYRVCPQGMNERLQQLKGLSIRPGFNQKVRELLGGVNGCTHVTELLGPIASTAFQTMYRATPSAQAGEKPVFLGTCHALAADGLVVREFWPEHYTGPGAAEE